MRKEEAIQLQVCNYLKIQYPKILFITDVAAGMKLSIGQAVKASKMRSNRGMPDLIILQPKGDYYHGLCLELKKDGAKMFKRNGEMVSDEHLQEQSEVLKRLRALNYIAEFAVGFDEAKIIIDKYLTN